MKTKTITPELKKYENDIKITKEFLKTKPWRKNEDQPKKWEIYLDKLSELHKVITPRLVIKPKIKTPRYDRKRDIVTLQKYSIISLLHEFGHHVGFGEEKTKTYSERVFFAAYPSMRRKLMRDDRGYLVKKPIPKPEDNVEEKNESKRL